MGKVEQAVEAAVDAIYFQDSSDYLSALYSVVRALNPLAFAMLPVDAQTAFYLYGSGASFSQMDRGKIVE